MHRSPFFISFIMALLAGFAASALTPTNLAQPYTTQTAKSPAPTGSSFNYNLGYYVQVTDINASVTVVAADTSSGIAIGPRVGSISVAYGLGYGLGVANYTVALAAVASPAQVIVPPPATVTVTTTQTITQTVTATTTQTTTQTVTATTTQTVTETATETTTQTVRETVTETATYTTTVVTTVVSGKTYTYTKTVPVGLTSVTIDESGKRQTLILAAAGLLAALFGALLARGGR